MWSEETKQSSGLDYVTQAITIRQGIKITVVSISSDRKIFYMWDQVYNLAERWKLYKIKKMTNAFNRFTNRLDMA